MSEDTNREKRTRKIQVDSRAAAVVRSRPFKVAVIVLLIAAALFLVAVNWRFLSYSERYVDKNEDTMSYTYYALGDHVLKCGLDAASYFDKYDNQLWTINYDMNEPRMVQCGSTAAVYDRLGTTICILTPEGEKGRLQTSLPILRVEVAATGMTAALLDDGNTARISCYNPDGTLVATIKTTMEANGYPMDIALSESGILLGVSYLQFRQGMPVTTVNFYNFGTRGKAATDNIISTFTYENRLIPEIHYMDNSTCVAFASDGFTLFKGKESPRAFRTVEIDGTIASTFFDDKHFGMAVRDEHNPSESTLRVYNNFGFRISSRKTDFAYSSISLAGKEIVMYNSSNLCITSIYGGLRYKGELTGIVRQVIPLQNLYYGCINDESYTLIRLR